MKNNYAQRRKEEKQALLDIGVGVGIQMMADFMSIALNDPEAVDKDIFGTNRLQKVLRRTSELHNTFIAAFGTGDEADYFREKLDQRLKQIYGDMAVPFEERYPHLKQIRYK